jgi:alpha-galactosidase/6-phospho-beta-glucosidase family protein
MKIAILGAGGMRLPLLAPLIKRRRLGLDALALMDIGADRLALMFCSSRSRRATRIAECFRRRRDQASTATLSSTFAGRHAGARGG